VKANDDESIVELQSRRSLLDVDGLGALQRVLVDIAPRWSRRLRFVEDESKNEYGQPFDLGTETSLFDAVSAQAAKPPSSGFRELERHSGSVGSRHRHLVPIAGSTTALGLSVTIDTMAFHPVGSESRFANSISVGLAGSAVEGTPVATWVPQFVAAVVEPCAIDYGFAASAPEYRAKNMSTEGGLRAIGRDIAHSLPGLYWLNYFGPVYCREMGRERLLSAPAHHVQAVRNGVLVQVVEHPEAWDSTAGLSRFRQVLEHIGPQYFFDRADPQRVTVSPDFKRARHLDAK
jgi:hypothetical protein